MIASELAVELGVDAGALSKRLALYFKESGRLKSRMLDESTVTQMREVDQLLKANKAKTAPEAIRKVLGTHVEALPPEVVGRLEQNLGRLEMQQKTILLHLVQLQNTLDGLVAMANESAVSG